MVVTTALLFVQATDAHSAAGTVTEQSGPTEIQRNKEVIPSAKDSGVEMNDAVVTANSKVSITFQDNSIVKITEQSKLVIDSFVYDPAKGDAGKVGLKMALGTAKFASGQIAKANPQNVSIETPTATVGVRGTDFSMTVDELGRSLIVLLPSCPVGWKNMAKDCRVGKITVTTDMGTVTLDQMFQSTQTVSRESNPAKPVILQLTDAQISNMLILTKPKRATHDETGKNILDRNELDKDLLRYDALNVDLLAESVGKLGQNYLDSAFLENIIDLMNAGLLDNSLNEQDDPMLPKYKPNKIQGLKFYVEDYSLNLYRAAPSHFAQVIVDKDSSAQVNLFQDGLPIQQQVNKPGGSVINIRQSK